MTSTRTSDNNAAPPPSRAPGPQPPRQAQPPGQPQPPRQPRNRILRLLGNGPFGAGTRPWVMAGAIFAAVSGSSLALNGVLKGWVWLPAALITVGAVALTAAVGRVLRIAALVPVLQAITLACVLTTQFLRAHSLFGFIPTSDTLEAFAPLMRRARETVTGESAPVEPNAGIVLVVCAGLGLVTILVDALAVSLLMPATSGLGLIAVLMVPALVKPSSVGLLGFLAAAAGYLLILGCSQWYSAGIRTGPATGRSAPQAARGVAIGAGGLVATLVLTSVVPGFTTGTFPQGSRFNPWGTATGLNPMVTLGNNLRSASGDGRMTYATTADGPLYLRSVTLEDFEGGTWRPTDREDQRRIGVGRMGDLQAQALVRTGVVTLTQIDSGDFSSPWLPAPYAPVGVFGLNGRWSWDPETLSIKGEDATTDAQTYTVRSVMPTLDAAALAAATAPPRNSLDRQFLALPSVPDIIKNTESDVVKDAKTPYQKALAIQTFLRAGNFIYSEQAPVDGGYDGSGLDVIAKFLQAKSGYCVHFASTMAVMARLAGIPSRIAVGYAPGHPTGLKVLTADGQELTQYQVDSRDAHAWPELYFEGLGWVPFEPTPSRGAVPDYAFTNNGQLPGTTSNDNLTAGQSAAPTTPAATPTPSASTSATAAGGAGESGTDWVPAIALLLAIAAILAIPGLARISLRRRRLMPGAAAWAELVDTARDFGAPPHPSETPRSFADRLGRSGALGGGQGSGAGSGSVSAALARIRQGYEEAAFAAPAGGEGKRTREASRVTDPETERDLAVLRTAFGTSAGGWRRFRAAVFPASVCTRWRSRLRHPFRRNPSRPGSEAREKAGLR